MKLLIVTQKVDKNDPILGFFHRWIEEFARWCESVTVICLEKGKYNLPKNVEILSLGKEAGISKIKYLFNLYKYIWQKRAQYGHIFVHMNQEYILLAGGIWHLMGRKIYLWRNHAKGNIFTDLAVLFSHKVFYTSPHSYTSRFKKSVKMPAGIDTDFFKPDPNVIREKGSVLLLGRISPVKKVLEFIEWAKDRDYKVTIAGSILAKDKEYGELVLNSLTPKIKYVGPVDQEGAKRLYQSHEIYANFTPAGSMDKTIIEAAACGMKLEVRNPDLKNFKVEDHNLQLLMKKIKMEIS